MALLAVGEDDSSMLSTRPERILRRRAMFSGKRAGLPLTAQLQAVPELFTLFADRRSRADRDKKNH